MPKFTVTEDMGIAIRNLRQRKGVKAIDVANSIGKTGAFISKLEKGVLNTIEEDDLIGIIKFLSNDKEELSETINLLLSDRSVTYSKEESNYEEWYMNMDLFYRKMSIPEEYLSIVNEKIRTLGISLDELVAYINSNHDLYNSGEFDKETLDKAEKNHWIFNNGNPFIVVNITKKDLEIILYEKNVSINYSMFMCILISLLRLEKMPYDEAYEQTYKILSDLKIQTLSEKNKIMDAYDKIDEMHSILDQRNNEALPKADRRFLTTLYDFTKKMHSFSELHGLEYSNKRLTTMLDNLISDPILFMGYIGVDLSKLEKCDFQVKKAFIRALNDLVAEYSVKIPSEEKQELL